MVIRQGDVLLVDFGDRVGSAPAYRRPAIVVQSDRFNESRINTVVVVAVTSNLKLLSAPGNVALRPDEANLRVRSVANVSQLATIDRAQAIRKLGSISRERLREVMRGIGLVLGADEVLT